MTDSDGAITDKNLREAVIATCRELTRRGLTMALPAISVCVVMSGNFLLVPPEWLMTLSIPTIFRSWTSMATGSATAARRANGGFIVTYSSRGPKLAPLFIPIPATRPASPVPVEQFPHSTTW